MKTTVRFAAVAAIALAPFAAHSQETQVLNACVDAFVAQSFADKSVTVRLERNYGFVPLVLQTGARVKLVASDKHSSRVLATATCSEKGGIITVEPAKNQLTAAM